MILANAAVAAVCLLYQPQYEAAALLEINEHTPYIAFPPTESGIPKDYFRTQVEIRRSKWILGRAIASANIKDLPEIRKQSDPVEWLKKRLSVVSPRNSGLFEIKLSCADPKNAALIANEVTRQYLTAHDEEESSRSRSILSGLNQQLSSREENVRALRQQVETATQKSTSMKDREQSSGERLNLMFKKKELAQAEKVLARISDRMIAMQTERSAPPRVIWDEPAKVPEEPIEVAPFTSRNGLRGRGGVLLPLCGRLHRPGSLECGPSDRQPGTRAAVGEKRWRKHYLPLIAV